MEESRSRSICLSYADSLEKILISSSSERLGYLRVHKMSFRDGPSGRGSLWGFSEFFGDLDV